MISKRDMILKAINDSEFELFPKQISKETGINHSTVRNYLRDLLDKGEILQPYKGTYASKITYGMMLAPIRVHNVILTMDAPFLKLSKDFVENIGAVKVRVQFGLQRKKISIRLSCSKGMSRDAFLLALHRSYNVIEDFTKYSPKDVTLKTFELNRDIAGVRIDGATCFTRTSFGNFIDRIYQKDGSVRSEVKVTGSMEIQQLTDLLKFGGGVPTSSVIQGQFMLVQEMKKIFRVLQQQQNQLKCLYEMVLGKNKRDVNGKS